MFTTLQRCSDFATIHSRVRLVSRSSSQSAPARIPCVCFPQLVDSLVRAMEFVTLRAGGREGSAVFFATEQLVCVPVKTALRLGIEIFEHIVEPAGPTGPQRLEFLDSPSECPSFLGYVHLFVPIDYLCLLRYGLLCCTEASKVPLTNPVPAGVPRLRRCCNA